MSMKSSIREYFERDQLYSPLSLLWKLISYHSSLHLNKREAKKQTLWQYGKWLQSDLETRQSMFFALVQQVAREFVHIELVSSVMNLNSYTNVITTNIEYTIDPQSKIEETTLYYYQTFEVGKHHTMDPIMEGILSCSPSSLRGHPPIKLQLQIQQFSSCPITLLKPLYIVVPSPKNILEEESSRSRTF